MEEASRSALTRYRRLIGGLAVVLGSAGALDADDRNQTVAAGEGPAETLTEVVAVTTPTHPNFIYTSGPAALGYWEAEGLDVDLEFIEGTAAAMQVLIGGQADVTIGTPIQALYAPYVEGIETIGFYNTTPANYIFPVVPVESGVRDLADLRGKRIGVASLASGQVGLFNAMAAKAGLNPADYTFVPVGRAAAGAAALFEQDAIDALVILTEHQVIIEAIDDSYALRRIPSPVDDAAFGMTPAVTLRERLESDRGQFVRWARGVAMASVFAKENLEAAAAIHSACFPESVPSAGSNDEAQEIATLSLQARFESGIDISTVPAMENWGEFVPEFIDTYTQDIALVDVPTFDGDPHDLFTNDLIAEINDFDEEEVQAQAREWSDTDTEAAKARCPG